MNCPALADQRKDSARKLLGQMKKWGVVGIFIGRFFGPLRASGPLIAGIFEMPFWQFQIANFISAFIWAATLLTIGDVISKMIMWLW